VSIIGACPIYGGYCYENSKNHSVGFFFLAGALAAQDYYVYLIDGTKGTLEYLTLMDPNAKKQLTADDFYFEFPPSDQIQKVQDGHIKIYFRQGDVGGPKSFYAYLDVRDIDNVRIVDSYPIYR
jgi:hypothetical protein